MNLNLGCGSNRITKAVNVDLVGSPDLIFDIKRDFPLISESIDEVYFFHTIEHIQKKEWPFIFCEIWRVLKDNGRVIVSYPEFSEIAHNWLENKHGQREFWEATIYGRQLYPSDFHVALMDSAQLVSMLQHCGFVGVNTRPEPINDYNTVLTARKGRLLLTYEEILRKDVWN